MSARTWRKPYVLIFLATIICFFAAKKSGIELPLRVGDFITYFLSVVTESLPFIVLGAILSSIIQVFYSFNSVHRHMPRNGMLRRLYISLLGSFLPVCECGNMPIARSLLRNGFSVADSLVFLFAAPVLNPITILTTIQAFGHDYRVVLGRFLGALFIANLVGFVFEKAGNKESLETEFEKSCHVSSIKKKKKSSEVLRLFTHETSELFPALLFGALLAALVQTFVSSDVLVSVGTNPLLAVIAMMLLAFVISICSNVDAFFALAFRSSFSSGALVSFLVFGPMIDIKMIQLMRTTYKKRLIVEASLLVAAASFLIGVALSYA